MLLFKHTQIACTLKTTAYFFELNNSGREAVTYYSIDGNNFVYTARNSFWMHNEVNFTELNKITNHCARRV